MLLVDPTPTDALSYKEQNKYIIHERSRSMIYLDSPLLIALATLIGSVATLVWAFRRKP